MEKSNKRGKIPQSDWPLIMARYEAGETLASIARTYDCSPPAISYVVSKNRARQSGAAGSAATSSGPEAQLVKARAGDPAEPGFGRRPRLDPPAALGETERRARMTPPGPATLAVPVARQFVPARNPRFSHEPDGPLREEFAVRDPQSPHPRTSRGTRAGRSTPIATAPAGDGTRQASPPLHDKAESPLGLSFPLDHNAASQGGSSDPLFPSASPPATESDRPAPAPPARLPFPASNRPDAGSFSEAAGVFERPSRPDGRTTGSDPLPRKDGPGAFIDQELRARVDTDIAAFLTAFDAALKEDTQENRFALREATDRLLRAGARTRIELERLEARIPLTEHDRGGDPGIWRYR